MYDKEFYARYDFMSKFTVIQENIPHLYFSGKIFLDDCECSILARQGQWAYGNSSRLAWCWVSVLNSILIDVIGFIFIREINLIYYQSSCTIIHYSETHNLY